MQIHFLYVKSKSYMYFVSLQRIIKKVVSDCVSEQNKRVSILW